MITFYLLVDVHVCDLLSQNQKYLMIPSDIGSTAAASFGRFPFVLLQVILCNETEGASSERVQELKAVTLMFYFMWLHLCLKWNLRTISGDSLWTNCEQRHRKHEQTVFVLIAAICSVTSVQTAFTWCIKWFTRDEASESSWLIWCHRMKEEIRSRSRTGAADNQPSFVRGGRTHQLLGLSASRWQNKRQHSQVLVLSLVVLITRFEQCTITQKCEQALRRMWCACVTPTAGREHIVF